MDSPAVEEETVADFPPLFTSAAYSEYLNVSPACLLPWSRGSNQHLSVTYLGVPRLLTPLVWVLTLQIPLFPECSSVGSKALACWELWRAALGIREQGPDPTPLPKLTLFQVAEQLRVRLKGPRSLPESVRSPSESVRSH